MRKILVSLSLLAFLILNAGESMKLKLSFDNESFAIVLQDNVATRDFVNLLPLELEFEDYAHKEKIAQKLPKKLDTRGLNGYDPQVGDLFYFNPWGNVGIFYEKQAFHSGLVKFGTLPNEAVAKIKTKNEDFVIKFEKVE